MIRGSVKTDAAKSNEGSLQIRKGKDTFCCNTKDVFAFVSMAADPIKEKGAFELSLKDAVAFMSANSTVDFIVCQQKSARKIVFSKVQFLVVRYLARATWQSTVGRFY